MKKFIVILFSLLIIGGVCIWFKYDDLKNNKTFNKVALKKEYTFEIANETKDYITGDTEDKKHTIYAYNDKDAYNEACRWLVAVIRTKTMMKESFDMNSIYIKNFYKNGKSVYIENKEEIKKHWFKHLEK